MHDISSVAGFCKLKIFWTKYKLEIVLIFLLLILIILIFFEIQKSFRLKKEIENYKNQFEYINNLKEIDFYPILTTSKDLWQGISKSEQKVIKHARQKPVINAEVFFQSKKFESEKIETKKTETICDVQLPLTDGRLKILSINPLDYELNQRFHINFQVLADEKLNRLTYGRVKLQEVDEHGAVITDFEPSAVKFEAATFEDFKPKLEPFLIGVASPDTAIIGGGLKLNNWMFGGGGGLLIGEQSKWTWAVMVAKSW